MLANCHLVRLWRATYFSLDCKHKYRETLSKDSMLWNNFLLIRRKRNLLLIMHCRDPGQQQAWWNGQLWWSVFAGQLEGWRGKLWKNILQCSWFPQKLERCQWKVTIWLGIGCSKLFQNPWPKIQLCYDMDVGWEERIYRRANLTK